MRTRSEQRTEPLVDRVLNGEARASAELRARAFSSLHPPALARADRQGRHEADAGHRRGLRCGKGIGLQRGPALRAGDIRCGRPVRPAVGSGTGSPGWPCITTSRCIPAGNAKKRPRDRRQQPDAADGGPPDPPTRPPRHDCAPSISSAVIAGMYVGAVSVLGHEGHRQNCRCRADRTASVAVSEYAAGSDTGSDRCAGTVYGRRLAGCGGVAGLGRGGWPGEMISGGCWGWALASGRGGSRGGLSGVGVPGGRWCLSSGVSARQARCILLDVRGGQQQRGEDRLGGDAADTAPGWLGEGLVGGVFEVAVEAFDGVAQGGVAGVPGRAGAGQVLAVAGTGVRGDGDRGLGGDPRRFGWRLEYLGAPVAGGQRGLAQRADQEAAGRPAAGGGRDRRWYPPVSGSVFALELVASAGGDLLVPEAR